MSIPTHPFGNTGLTLPRIGLGLAALGRPGYINLGHGQDLDHEYDVQAMAAHAQTVLDAANFFAPVVNGEKQKAPLRYNEFGGTIGGPVLLPKKVFGPADSRMPVMLRLIPLMADPIAITTITPMATPRMVSAARTLLDRRSRAQCPHLPPGGRAG